MSGTARQAPIRDELRRMTAPGLLVERARQSPNDVAFRAKRLGIYRERTWRDYAEMVARTAKAWRWGLRTGDRVAIMADVCEEWLVCDQAAQSLGAIVYGIYPRPPHRRSSTRCATAVPWSSSPRTRSTSIASCHWSTDCPRCGASS